MLRQKGNQGHLANHPRIEKVRTQEHMRIRRRRWVFENVKNKLRFIDDAGLLSDDKPSSRALSYTLTGGKTIKENIFNLLPVSRCLLWDGRLDFLVSRRPYRGGKWFAMASVCDTKRFITMVALGRAMIPPAALSYRSLFQINDRVCIGKKGCVDGRCRSHLVSLRFYALFRIVNSNIGSVLQSEEGAGEGREVVKNV